MAGRLRAAPDLPWGQPRADPDHAHDFLGGLDQQAAGFGDGSVASSTLRLSLNPKGAIRIFRGMGVLQQQVKGFGSEPSESWRGCRSLPLADNNEVAGDLFPSFLLLFRNSGFPAFF